MRGGFDGAAGSGGMISFGWSGMGDAVRGNLPCRAPRLSNAQLASPVHAGEQGAVIDKSANRVVYHGRAIAPRSLPLRLGLRTWPEKFTDEGLIAKQGDVRLLVPRSGICGLRDARPSGRSLNGKLCILEDVFGNTNMAKEARKS